jgi:hypothetical protein
LATRKSSAASTLIETTDYSKTIITSLTTNNTNTTNNTITNDLKDPILQKGFEKALRDASKESNLDKKLNEIKSNYESNKYDELITRLRDAESKNEYLTNIIAQLQSKRSINSGFRFVLHTLILILN